MAYFAHWLTPVVRPKRFDTRFFVRLAPPALTHVSFVGAGGAEANEKALRLARLHVPPRADGQPADAKTQPLSVLINAQGRYFVGDREVLRTDVESLKQSLRDVAGDDRERTVLIRADARTPWQAVITAYEALGQLGFKRVANATASQAGGTQGGAATQ